MRIVLDACLPRKLARTLPGHVVTTTHALGLADLDDGPLLDVLQNQCDVFVTMDRSLAYQQNLTRLPFGIVVLRARSNRLPDLLPLIPPLLTALADVVPGQVHVVGA